LDNYVLQIGDLKLSKELKENLLGSDSEGLGMGLSLGIIGVRSHHTPPELPLWSHCQAFWRHASPPSTPVTCRFDSGPSPWPKLEASPRPSQQPMDWPATQGQQQHATSWPVQKIHHTWSFGSDATVLDNYTRWWRRRSKPDGRSEANNFGAC